MDVDELILDNVSKRIGERRDSLKALLRFKGRGLGIEAWFKVETIAALESISKVDVNNKGPDLKIAIDGKTKEIELKAHTDGFAWIKNGIEQHEKSGRHVDSCLFLMPKRKNPDKDEEKLKREGFQVSIRDIDSNWIVGLLKRK